MSKTIVLSCAALACAMSAPAQAASIVGLFNSGTDANNVALVGGNGLVDTHYTIISSTSGGVLPRQAVTYTNTAYVANDANSRWISLNSNGNPGSNTTVYRLTFDLTGLDASTASISGTWAADNFGSILLNGNATGFALTGSPTSNFNRKHAFTLSSGFVSGINTLDFSVGDTGQPTALRVDDLVGTADLAAAVPEPGTWALLILGFGIIGAGMRRREQGRSAYAMI